MSQAEQERLVYQLPPRLRHQHIYTQDEVVDMFAECERNETGDIVFQAFAEYANHAKFLMLGFFFFYLIACAVLPIGLSASLVFHVFFSVFAYQSASHIVFFVFENQMSPIISRFLIHFRHFVCLLFVFFAPLAPSPPRPSFSKCNEVHRLRIEQAHKMFPDPAGKGRRGPVARSGVHIAAAASMGSQRRVQQM